MRCYFAPLEGITGYVYRNIHHRYFPGVDKYFMPFLSPSQDHVFTKKDRKEVSPEHNEGLCAVPQLMTRRSEDFIWACGALAEMGYREVNLNLGCPSGTVTAKGKGAGFLRFPEELDRFLEEVFSRVDVAVSVKTRLGFEEPEEFERLLEIYNQYPIAELIVHPRVRRDFYRGGVRMASFQWAAAESANPLCYNGDLVTAAEWRAFRARFPAVERVMIGRGLVGDPALAAKAGGGAGAGKAVLRAFHDALYDAYAEAFASRRNAMLRMKEVWFYLIHLFADSDRHAKGLKKAADTAEYEDRVADVFRELTLLENSGGGWRGPEGDLAALF